MRKASKRRVRLVSEPAMTRLITNPEIGIVERMAVEAMRGLGGLPEFLQGAGGLPRHPDTG